LTQALILVMTAAETAAVAGSKCENKEICAKKTYRSFSKR
jgi:hypothetical protein